MKILPGIAETFKAMKGHKFIPNDGEGVIYVKLVALKPETIESGDPESITNSAQGVVVLGSLDNIKDQFNQWLDQIIEEYKK